MVPVPLDPKSAAALSGPLTKFIEVVGQGMGTAYTPVGTVLQAGADAVAAIIRAQGDIKVKELQQRAVARLLTTETERQKNLEAIVRKAQLALPAQVSDKPIEKDWITHFFDLAKDVSDEEMRGLWARILAGEIAEPGKTSRRALESLKVMNRWEAEAFAAVVTASVQMKLWFVLFEDPSVYSAIQHLISLGLIPRRLRRL